MKGKGFKNLWAGLQDGDTVSQLLTFYKKDGGQKYYKANFSTIKNLTNVVVKILCVLVDVSKEVEQEKALKVELEEALNNSMIKVTDEEKDTQGAMVALNDALEELNKGDLDVESLIEKNKLPILVIDKSDLKITDSTLIMQALLGFEKEELNKKSLVEIVGLDDPDKAKILLKNIEEANIFQDELIIKGKESDQKLTVLFASILGASNEDTKICMITLSM